MPGFDGFEPAYPEGPPPEAPAAPEAPTSRVPAYQRQQIIAFYQQYLGRMPSAAEIDSYYGNPNYEETIKNSPEAQAYATHTEAAGGTTQADQGPQHGDYRGWFNRLTEGKPVTQETLMGLEPILNQYGISIQPANAAGERTKLRLPDGSVVRVGFGEGRWVWTGQGGGGGGDATTTAPKTPATFYEAPEAFSYPDFVPPDFQAPGPFSYAEFAPPSGQDVLNEDPGYQFRKTEGDRALTNAASMQGLLKSGSFAKNLLEFSQGLGAQEYGGAFNRRFGTWQANRAAKGEDYDRLWRDMLTKYGVAENTYKTNLGTKATGYGFGLDVAAGKAGGKQGASQFGLASQNSQFGNLLNLYDLATRNLPRYQPTSSQASYGFGA